LLNRVFDVKIDNDDKQIQAKNDHYTKHFDCLCV
jgi:hypothetical protein